MFKVPVEVRRHSPESSWTYTKLDLRQREVASLIRDGGTGVLLLSELAPVITLGKRTSPKDVLLSPENLAKLEIELHHTDRGGLATYHGPGQWVLFAVDSLERLVGDPRGVRKAVDGLLEIALEVGRFYDLNVEIRQGCELGVWNKQGKFAAVGVHVEQGVLLHGLAVNGFRTEVSFLGLKPCGLDAPVSFLLPDHTGFESLKDRLVETAFKRLWR